ncbi:TonB-dependent receptor domain-containing protein [Pinibacter aurantiacus]|uniref:TonB-dependent receptor n=1 Tax=Pinibacter aurantiacus TaxID=2851599 RepID=A0A9E2W703_9BACT|nr:TonB-dependent receptor [Pinibacter aurantiacus]MBV4360438.1 TonB-dependent receptor [Pinibacter aurantiacus]
MKNLFLTLGVLFFCSSLFAQQADEKNDLGKISGRVTDAASRGPLEYATITVLDSINNKTITGSTSAKDGYFIVADVSAGRYRVTIECIGYKPVTLPGVEVTKNGNTSLKTIQLVKEAQSLAEVTVTARPKLVENKIDKMVFNAEKDLTSAGGVAADVLKKVPQVSIDVDGNVQLAGNGGIRFLINGRPSTAFGSNIADVLQSIPASNIKSIEVITNPGAKYDAQGMGGIINIILKSSKAKGYNGSISLTAGTRAQNGSFNFNARKDNFAFNAFVSGNTRFKVTTPYTSARNSFDTASKTTATLLQDGNTNVKRKGAEGGMGIDWTWKKYNSIAASVNYNAYGVENGGAVNQLQQLFDAGGNSLANIASLNNRNTKNSWHATDIALNYKRTFAKEDQELNFSVNSSLGRSHISANNLQYAMPQDSLTSGTMNTNPGKENETQIALDYSQPIASKVMMGAGLKTTFLDIASDADVLGYYPAQKAYYYDSSLSNSLDYRQKVYAAYAELSFPVANLFDVKVGSRYERTETSSYYSNAQKQVATPGYNTFVPSVYLSKKIGEKQHVKLSYSKRIERPDYGDLNPFINTSDPKNITAGNPYLKPEIGHRIEAGYGYDFGKGNSVMLTAFYRHNMDDIQPYVTYYPSLQVGDSTYYNVSVSTRENIGTEDNTGLNVFADVFPVSKLEFRTNLSFFHRKINNQIDVGQSRTSFNYRINANLSYEFNNTLSAEFFGNFNSARNEVQGKYPSFTTYSFAVRKMFWNKKGSLALSANNPFNEYVTQKTELYGSNFTTTSIRKIPYRSVSLNFTWKFGALVFKKEKEKEAQGDDGGI